MANSADPDQLASSEANWSGSTLFAKTGHVVFSKRRVKTGLGALIHYIVFPLTAPIPSEPRLQFFFVSSSAVSLWRLFCHRLSSRSLLLKTRCAWWSWHFLGIFTNMFGASELQSTLFIPTLDTTTKFVIMTIWISQNLLSRGDN